MIRTRGSPEDPLARAGTPIDRTRGLSRGQPTRVVSRITHNNYPSPNAARTRTQAAANVCLKPLHAAVTVNTPRSSGAPEGDGEGLSLVSY